MLEVAEQVFDLPVRLGQPGGVSGLTEPASGPQFATAVGLALYSAHNAGNGQPGLFVRTTPFLKIGSAVRSWFAEMF
jgi:cell division protein FtsA